jgi:cobalt-zinc-cadmium resistance protein CzcA
MLETIIRFSIQRATLILVAIVLVSGLGVWNFTRLPIDAVPDITNVQVVINTESAGYTPLEVEQRVSYPIETSMAGLPNLMNTRSLSRYGLSQVTIIFQEGTDIYFARQLVSERLSAAKSNLPKGLEPLLGPISTGLGEIFMFTVDAELDALNADGSVITPTDLRSVHDWIIRPQLLRVPGVVEVNPIGGFKREILVSFVPADLLAHGVTQADLIAAIEANNENRGVGYIEHNGAQWLLRVSGQINQLQQLADILVAEIDGQPVRLKDIASISEGKELRSGAGTQNGREVVMSTVFMLIGENSRTVAKAVAAKLEEIKISLPEGVTVAAVYDRSILVEKTLKTVQTNLLEGALLVIVILFFFLGNMKAALITAAVIPIAMLMTITGMVQTQVSANLMSLGALDFGLIVDGAIIIVENCLRRLSSARREGEVALKERFNIVFEATREVIRPAMFGMFIVTIVYLPIFALTGVEGKMFHPMAITVIIALVSAMLLSITFVPACIALFFKDAVEETEGVIMKVTSHFYQPVLVMAVKFRWLVVSFAFVLMLVCGYTATKLGSEFVPDLDEGDIAMHALRVPGTSLQQAIQLQLVLEDKIKTLPEVERIFSKIGTAEVATDPMPPSVADTFIILKPREQWPNPNKLKEQFVDELAVLVEPMPASRYEFLQPIQMRFNELLAGVRAELAIKVFGDDFDQLIELGHQIEKAIVDVEGIVDIAVEQTSGLPIMTIKPKRQALLQYGLSIKEIQDQLSVALAGHVAGQFYEGDRRTDLVVRLPENLRSDIDALAKLPIQRRHGDYVPLEELAELELVAGYNQIYRENSKRRVFVTANVRGRDLGSFVKDVKKAVNLSVEIPAAYWIEYGGTYQKLESASERLTLIVPFTLLLIVGILFFALGSIKDTIIIFSGVPLALTGGILFLFIRDIPFSISAAIGFIALSGIAILDGLVMLSFIRDLRKDGLGLDDAIIKGAITRLRPVLTTTLVASLGFIPMALNTGIGSEVQRPLATVVIGGVISATLLTLVVLPALYRLLHTDLKSKAI